MPLFQKNKRNDDQDYFYDTLDAWRKNPKVDFNALKKDAVVKEKEQN